MSISTNMNHPLSFTTKIKEWGYDFLQFTGLKVAIARKAPRMVELCEAEDIVPESRGEGAIVSEHALPFLSFGDFKQIAIADDAIYFGSTFERIYSIILTGLCLFNSSTRPEKVRGIPAVVSDDAKRFNRILDRTNSDYMIKNENIPYYINTLITKFQTLGKPYDIEFPLIYFYSEEDLDFTTVKQLIFSIQKRLEATRNCNLPEPYALEHAQSGCKEDDKNKNFTLVLNQLSPRNRYAVTSEFRKIRLFFCKNRLCIASFAPHIFTESMLTEDSPLFKHSKMEEIWKIVWNAAVLPSQEQKAYRSAYKDYLIRQLEDDSAAESLWNKQVREYMYHRNHSLVVWANYLLSFNMLLDVKHEIGKAVDELPAIKWDRQKELLQNQDLVYLIGESLAEKIRVKLEKLYREDEEVGLMLVGMDPISSFEVMPTTYEENFRNHNQDEFTKCRSVSELVSCNYSNQHRYLELASRVDLMESFDRLRFGESFTSMSSKFAIYYNGLNFNQYLHRAMDERIDMGSIVPKYVRFGEYNDAPWIRLFRSGENEDKYKDQLHRIIWLMLTTLVAEYNSSILPNEMIHCCFNLIAGNMAHENLFRNLGGITFQTVYKDGEYRTSFVNEISSEEKNEPNYERDLLDYSLDYDLLITDKNSSAFCSLNRTEYSSYLSRGSILDVSTENLVRNYVKTACFICNQISAEQLRELYNWLAYREYKDIDESLTRWRDNNFIPALDKEWDTIDLSEALATPFLGKMNAEMEQFPSIPEVEEVKKKLTNAVKGEKSENLQFLCSQLVCFVKQKVDQAKTDNVYGRIDKKVDLYYALSYFALVKLIREDFSFLDSEIDDLLNMENLKALKENSHVAWLNKMKETDFFNKENIENMREHVKYFLNLPI